MEGEALDSLTEVPEGTETYVPSDAAQNTRAQPLPQAEKMALLRHAQHSTPKERAAHPAIDEDVRTPPALTPPVADLPPSVVSLLPFGELYAAVVPHLEALLAHPFPKASP